MDIVEAVNAALAKSKGRMITTSELAVFVFKQEWSKGAKGKAERQQQFRSLLNLAKSGYPGAMAQPSEHRVMYGRGAIVTPFKWLAPTPEELAGWTAPTAKTPPAGPSVALEQRLAALEQRLAALEAHSV